MTVLDEIGFGVVRVDFCLVNDRSDSQRRLKFFHMPNAEIAHSTGPHFSGINRILDRSPALSSQ